MRLRHLLLVSLLLCVPSSIWAQNFSARYDNIAISNRGLPFSNQNVAVCTQPANVNTQPCSPLATLSTSLVTNSGGTNPLTTDVNGNFHFYAVPGIYTIMIYGPQVQTPIVLTDVAVGVTGAALAITGQATSLNIGSGATLTSSGGGGTTVTTPTGATALQSIFSAAGTALTFTPPLAAGSYRIRFTLSLQAANAATLGWTATWKDAAGNAQAPTNLSLYQSGTAAPALTFTTSSTGDYYGDAQIDIDASATNVLIKITFSGTSFTGKVSASIERVI